jgi:hypothetical protein
MSTRKYNSKTTRGAAARPRQNKQKQHKKKLSLRGMDLSTLGEVKIMRNPMPDAIFLTLKGEDIGIYGNTGSLYQGEYYAMNGAETPSSFSTVSMVPFVEYSAFFNTYKVVEFRIHSTFTALESFPVFCVIGPSTTSLGSNNSNLRTYSTNNHWKREMLSAKGGPIKYT